MVRSTHKCGRPNCCYVQGMQCEECNKWFHKICTRINPTAYKRCSKPNFNWLCMFCCSSNTLLIQETISFLVLARKKVYEGWTGNMGTDSEECVSVVSAVTERVRLSTVWHAIGKSPLKQLKSEPPLDIDGHVARVVTDDLDKTDTVPGNHDSDALNDGKWWIVRKQRREKTATNSAQLVDKSLLGSHWVADYLAKVSK